MKGAFTSVQSNLLHSPRRECSHFRASPWDVTQSCCASHWDTTQHPRHPSPPLSRPWDATRCCCSLQRVTLIPLSWLATQRRRRLHTSSWHGTRCCHPLHVSTCCAHPSCALHSPLTTTAPANAFWGVDAAFQYGGSTFLMDTGPGIFDTGTTMMKGKETFPGGMHYKH
jgi:hypothetical protein